MHHPDEVQGALRHGELVVLATAQSNHPRHAGAIDPAMIGAALKAGAPVYPVASMSSPFGRRARVHVGAAVRPRTRRRGPLAETELAEMTQRHLQRILDELGGARTGVAPLDWVGEG